MNPIRPRAALLLLLLPLTGLAGSAIPARGPLDHLTAPQPGTRHREAGSWVAVPPGQAIDLLSTASPGRIVRIWATVAVQQPHTTRALSLEAYWDGAAEPAIRVPLGDFFGVGHGEGGELNSLPVQALDDGYSCFWPMPFLKGARLMIRNDGPKEARIYYQVDWDALAPKEVDPMRFQASWRREAATDPARPFLIADIHGQGHYVGTVLSIDPKTPGWWGEGDDIYYVDGQPGRDGAGQPTPWTIRGTGTEDLVMQGFGLVPSDSAFAGAVDQPGRHLTLYRWFVQDPLPFRERLQVFMEQQGRPVQARSDDVSGAGFWYQLPPLSSVPALPAFAERLPAPPLAASAWEFPAGSPPAIPADLRAAATTSRASNTCLPPARHTLNRPVGVQDLSGVRFELLPDCDRPSAVSLSGKGAGGPISVALPPGGTDLYLLLAADGERDQPALTVTSGAWSETLRFGTHLDPFNDPWPVPSGRIAFLTDAQLRPRAVYAARISLPPGADRVALQAAPGAEVTVFAISRGG